MASKTLSQLGDILKDIYMGGPPQPIVKPIKWWSCHKHKHPNYGRFEERCEYDDECDDYECPHRVSVKVSDGCSECAKSEYVHVLDGDTGEPAYEAIFRSGIAWQLEHESILINELLRHNTRRERYGS